MTLPRGMPGFRGLSHLSPAGDARMVDVSAKAETVREAVARVTVAMKPATLAMPTSVPRRRAFIGAMNG